MPPVQPAPSGGNNWGAIIGIIIIVAILAAGGAYFFYTQGQQQPATDQTGTAATTEQVAQTPADSTDTIEADLNATATTSSQGDLDSLNQAL